MTESVVRNACPVYEEVKMSIWWKKRMGNGTGVDGNTGTGVNGESGLKSLTGNW